MANAAAEIASLYRFRWEVFRPGTPQEFNTGTQEARTDIERWANRALAIDPHCSRAWAALVWSEYESPIDQRKVLEDALKAVSLERQDSFAHTSLGGPLQIISNELAVAAYLEARRLDPLYAYSYSNASSSMVALGRYTEALAIAEDGLNIESEMVNNLKAKYLALTLLGRHDEAFALARQQQIVTSDPGTEYVFSAEEGDAEG